MLQNALNDSSDIFLLGEPDLLHDQAPGFAARFNALQRSWGNQETKSNFCPPVLEQDGTWRDYFEALSLRYRWVGAKLVINPIRPLEALTETFDFLCRHFYDAHYIFTFRDPLAMVMSTHDLQILTQGKTDGVRIIMRNAVDIVAFYVRMLRNLPNVRAIFHEDVNAETFKNLQSWLHAPLEGSATYYDAARTRSYDDAHLTTDERDAMAVIQQLYKDLRHGVASGFATPQLEQNDRHLGVDHYTVLGSIDRRARTISEHLLRLG